MVVAEEFIGQVPFIGRMRPGPSNLGSVKECHKSLKAKRETA